MTSPSHEAAATRGHKRLRRWIPVMLLAVASGSLALVVWYRGQNQLLDVTTGSLFLATLSLTAFLVAEVYMRARIRSADRKISIRLLLATATLLLFVSELFLRYGIDRYATYFEQNGETNYRSVYDQTGPTWFHTYPPNTSITYLRTEFTHNRNTNSLGLPEVEFDSSKAPNEYRIIALGDSYTEGIGTAYDSTWVKVVERELAAKVPNKIIRTINAGVSGSDVHFQYMLLKERLLAFDPDLVVLATNNSDIGDVMIRGGFERFHPDGSVVAGRSGPPWESLYAISYMFRVFIHDVLRFNYLFVHWTQVRQRYSEAAGEMLTAIDSVASLSASRGFQLLVVVHPNDWEAEHDEWTVGIDDFVAGLADKKSVVFLDLLDYYRTHQVLTPATAGEFFWPIDLHYNTTGYAAMGHAITETIRARNLIEG